jgi:hypothetical protein
MDMSGAPGTEKQKWTALANEPLKAPQVVDSALNRAIRNIVYYKILIGGLSCSIVATACFVILPSANLG